MIEINVTARRWGRSLGAVIPKEKAEAEGINEGDDITMLIKKKSKNPLKLVQGAIPDLGDVKELLDEVDREGWDD